MDISRIISVMCVFLLAVCLILSISTLTVLRNAVDGRELLHEVTSMRMEDRGIELELPPNGLIILTVEQ